MRVRTIHITTESRVQKETYMKPTYTPESVCVCVDVSVDVGVGLCLFLCFFVCFVCFVCFVSEIDIHKQYPLDRLYKKQATKK